MFLDQIVSRSKERVQALESSRGVLLSQRYPKPRSLRAALMDVSFGVIAECKRRSPSRGWLVADPEAYDPQNIARHYAATGANAISVLTEPEFFAGSLEHLRLVAKAVEVPVLRKDFLWDPVQVYEARQAGADVVLIIVRIISDTVRLQELMAAAQELGMDALVEIHAESEVDAAMHAGAKIIGVNNRDLDSFETRLELSQRVSRVLPDTVLKISESGIQTLEELEHIRRWGYQGVLIGEAFMRGGPLLEAVQQWRLR